jgi:hypothetical protein
MRYRYLKILIQETFIDLFNFRSQLHSYIVNESQQIRCLMNILLSNLHLLKHKGMRLQCMRYMRLQCMILCTLCILWSCESNTPISATTPANTSTDMRLEVNDMQLSLQPDAILTQDNPTLAEYGEVCAIDDDCYSQLCIPDGEQGICTVRCSDRCNPFGDRSAFCRLDPSQERADFLCQPQQIILCQRCASEIQCDGGACIEIDGSNRCTLRCEEDIECPNDYRCDPQQSVCLPNSGSCDCNSETDGQTRVCEQVSEFGICFGEETCDSQEGWIGCNAPLAEAEVCDGVDQNCNQIIDEGSDGIPCMIENEFGTCAGINICQAEQGLSCYGEEPQEEFCDLIDNDCDGLVDEAFTSADGLYTQVENCGRCGQNCNEIFSSALSVECQLNADEPTCVITECQAGTQLVNGVACLPLQEVLCESCVSDEECNTRSPGASCVPIGSPDQPETYTTVCGRDCNPNGSFGNSCPDGFVCQRFSASSEDRIQLEVNDANEDDLYQCVPNQGHCLCIDNSDLFSVACSVQDPQNPALSCGGQRTCIDGDFGDCLLPPDTCDGIDNDCDGRIDNQYRDEQGGYTLDNQHCGRCFRNCNSLNYANANSICNIDTEDIRCEMECIDGFVDLINGSDDGCECEIVVGEDLPDGVDQNCDGIDGDLSKALFVSKIGDNQNNGSRAQPLLSITTALQRAQNDISIRDIYVATGVYSENIIQQNRGISLYGGYSLDFANRDPQEHPTTLLGRVPSDDERATLTLVNIQNRTRIDGFSIYAADAVDSAGNSIAVFVRDCNQSLWMSNNDIFAGTAGRGRSGGSGTSGVSGSNGSSGSDAFITNTSFCSNTNGSAGNGGVNVCEQISLAGGNGGAAQCPQTQNDNGSFTCTNPNSCRNSCNESPCDPLPPPQPAGEAGAGPGDAPGGTSTYDRWSDQLVCGRCSLYPELPSIGASGTNGPNGISGIAGQGCNDTVGSLDMELHWINQGGTFGEDGTHGTGGGGGSAGSGFDITFSTNTCFDSLGGSGGGGGAGGCRALGGSAGQSGGGSFAIMLIRTQIDLEGTPRLETNQIRRGTGGAGGRGGNGGVGGGGGEGGFGGVSTSAVFCTQPGGRGGNGGIGGSGGGGGGGCGGPASSIYTFGFEGEDLSEYLTANTLINSGTGGEGGQGGNSTVNPGLSGSNGVVADLIQQ